MKSEELELPSVIVVGDQSVGKSSLIVAMIGMDILPRKEGTCTRTPLEIHMRRKNKFDTETGWPFSSLPSHLAKTNHLIPKSKIYYSTIRLCMLACVESSFARFEATSAVEVKDVPDIFKGSVLTPARPLPSKVLPLTNDRKNLHAIRVCYHCILSCE
jgi:GTPase SAR1 family protein